MTTLFDLALDTIQNLHKRYDACSNFSSIIDNAYQASNSHFNVSDPFDNNPIAQLDSITVEQIELAIKSSHQAQQLWKHSLPKTRADLLMSWHQRIVEHKTSLATLITKEQGKPIRESLSEIDYALSYIDWFAEQARRITGTILPSTSPNQQLSYQKQAVGVVAAITPWNFPVAMLTRKIAPAIAAGCSVIIKPSELTPLSALAIHQLAIDAGFPAGLLNTIIGENAELIGSTLLKHQTVKKLSFTGSTQTGKHLLTQAAKTVKRTSMELGGNAPFIIFESANLNHAVECAISAKFRNGGQACVAANRFLIHHTLYDAFIAQYCQRIRDFKIGNGLDKKTVIGPVINHQAKDKIDHLISSAIKQGAQLEIPAKSLSGNFVQPQLLTSVTPDMAIWQQEIFGPVATAMPFSTQEEAIKHANETEYGLAAYFFSQNVQQINDVINQLEYGMVGINEGVISNATAPFGGIKESGLGREGSSEGIDEYLNIKYCCQRF